MIVCPTCKHRNSEGAQTCASCGGSLADFVYRACPACDSLNAAENVFCHRCLTPLGASHPNDRESLADEVSVQEETTSSDKRAAEGPAPIDSEQVSALETAVSEPSTGPTSKIKAEPAGSEMEVAARPEDATLFSGPAESEPGAVTSRTQGTETAPADTGSGPETAESNWTKAEPEAAGFEPETAEAQPYGAESEAETAESAPEPMEAESEAAGFEPKPVDLGQQTTASEPKAVEIASEPGSEDDLQKVTSEHMAPATSSDEAPPQDSSIRSMASDPEAGQAIEGRAEAKANQGDEPDISREPLPTQESAPVVDRTEDLVAPEAEEAASIEAMGVWMADEALSKETGAQEDDSHGSRTLLPDSEYDAASPAQGGRSRELAKPPSVTPLQRDTPQSAEEPGIPVEMVVSLPHRAALPTRTGPSDADRLDADLFQRIAREPASLDTRLPSPDVISALPSAGASSHWRGRLGQIALRLSVLLAAIVPLITGSFTTRWVQPRDSVLAAARALDAIPAGAAVLISFDYGPSYAGEIEPLARAIVHQLASHSVQTIAMSTLATGPAMAERVYDTVSLAIPEYTYGQDYAILGFLPGQEAGLRLLKLSFADAFRADHLGQALSGELPVVRNIATLQDFDQIIVLADDGSSVRNWVEQVGGTEEIVLHAFVSARLAPLLQPYYQSGQLESLISAADGSAEYELASGAPPSQLLRTDSFAVLFLIFTVIAIVTNIVWLSREARRRSGK